MSERAAVLRALGKPLELEDIELAALAPDQVRVRIAASGVCHSDLSQTTGVLPAGTPCVLGHEGAGVIEAVGSGGPSCATGRSRHHRLDRGLSALLVLPARRASPVPERHRRFLCDAVCSGQLGRRTVHIHGSLQLRVCHQLPWAGGTSH